MQSRFVITCAARTGSTMLRYLLDSHPQIYCHGEAFVRQGYLRFIFKNRRSFGLAPGYKRLLPAYKHKKIEDFLSEDFLQVEDPKIRAIGFKFKTDEYFDPGYKEIASYLKTNRKLKVIHLRRRDLLAQYISYEFVRKGIKPTVSFEPSEGSSHKIKIKKSHLFRYLSLVYSRELKIEEELKEHRIYRVWYESIISGKGADIPEMLKFLGVPEIILKSKTKKLISDYTSHISNLQEVYEWLEDSIYAKRTQFYPPK